MRRSHYRLAAAAAFLLCMASLAKAVRADEIVTVPTCAAVTQSYLLLPPRTVSPAAPPKIIGVMFPGGYGELHLLLDGSGIPFGMGGNFLVRTREQFRDQEIGVASLEAPTVAAIKNWMLGRTYPANVE